MSHFVEYVWIALAQIRHNKWILNNMLYHLRRYRTRLRYLISTQWLIAVL